MRVSGYISIIPSIMSIAIWLWILDVLGLDVWAAGRMAHFINLVTERLN